MSKPIIAVENLGKQYQLGSKIERYPTFRDAIAGAVKAPFQRFKQLSGGGNADRFWALRNVSFEVERGEVIGIIGRNGAGKSTLLKMLSRIVEPTEGRAILRGRVASLLEVGTGFHPELSGRENVYLNGSILGMRKGEIDRKFDEIVAFASIEKFLDTPVKHYSSGMYVRLAFAVAAHLEPEILVVDEVLAVGDAEFQKKCMGKMQEVAKGHGRTVLFVSHNMAAIQKLCRSAVLLEKGKLAAVGPSQPIVARYLQSGQHPIVKFASGPLKQVQVQQVGHEIVIEAEFNTEEPVALPCLGFVISATSGGAICGCNPKHNGVEAAPQRMQNGKVEARFSSPALANGTYFLSVWFGNGSEDWVAQDSCLSFEVVNMVPPAHVHYGGAPIVPDCTWSFESTDSDSRAQDRAEALQSGPV